MEKSGVKLLNPNHSPHSPSDILALPLQARAGPSATLRGQPGLTFQSQNIGKTQSVVAASGTTK
jgi:hypothetical protein